MILEEAILPGKITYLLSSGTTEDRVPERKTHWSLFTALAACQNKMRFSAVTPHC
jgi:hypothetical protein